MATKRRSKAVTSILSQQFIPVPNSYGAIMRNLTTDRTEVVKPVGYAVTWNTDEMEIIPVIPCGAGVQRADQIDDHEYMGLGTLEECETKDPFETYANATSDAITELCGALLGLTQHLDERTERKIDIDRMGSSPLERFWTWVSRAWYRIVSR
jgi:hypothetical protein